MIIRKSEIKDVEIILEIFTLARDFMNKNGNPNQWSKEYPSKEQIKNDINMDNAYLIISNEGRIIAYFVLVEGDDPTYECIEGEWINENPYVTIHRIASTGEEKGIFNTIVNFTKERFDNIRIDTHEDNMIMKKLIINNDFKKCGIIYVNDGSPRIAYQYSKKF
ncbi:N-acetyltransferase [Peptostreptococcus equinus]|uniref:N-acetyltransferase n=1 Tax=Peptostreptococcus equinus TaxID=3003601 RepID=A0ABY7JUA4_9FIRM|nr:N-acetyltransferase [Peptostreptococcus sp. CBA3647]WAW15743.1 N-acetyltransferase [Peptostreptococcus sp. CBA3647]